MTTLAVQTLEQLRSAMKTKGDFPAVSSTMDRIMRAMEDDANCSDNQLASLVLSDFSLTQKVLRLANSPMYASFGPVSTVSMAIYVLGVATVGHVAMSMTLVDNLDHAADTKLAKQELAKAVLAGAIARNVGVAASGKDGEPLAVATLLRNLGKLLVCVYLPDRFARITEISASYEEEDQASQAELGMSYDDLALVVARGWNIPAELKARATPPYDTTNSHINWIHAVSGYALHYTAAAAEGHSSAALQAIASAHADAVGVPASELMAQAQSAVAQAVADADGAVPAFMAIAAQDGEHAAATVPAGPAAGLADLAAIRSGMTPAQILGVATEALWKGLGCSRFMLFLRNRSTSTFDMVLGRGDGVAEQVRKLKFPAAFSPNIVHFAMRTDAPLYLTDAFEPNIAKRIPQWLLDACVPVKNLFLMPFAVQGQPAGIIYLDWVQPRGPLNADEQALVEQLHQRVRTALASALAS